MMYFIVPHCFSQVGMLQGDIVQCPDDLRMSI